MTRSRRSPVNDSGRKVVLYVAGYGRSGSTALSIILGNHPEMASLGEVSFLFEDWENPKCVCSCAERYSTCSFWHDLFSDSDHRALTLARRSREVERLRFLPFLIGGFVAHRRARAYREAQRKVFDYVQGRTGRRIVIDSSKSVWATAGRFLALKRLAGFEVKVLHLVRDGRSTLQSVLCTGSNWALEGRRPEPRVRLLRGALGWVCVNLLVSIVGHALGPDRYLCLRYEDLIKEPEAALRRIGHFVSVDTEPLIQHLLRKGSFQVGHLVGGNRLRFNGEIMLESDGARRAQAALRLHQRLLFFVVGSWLNRLYGYRN